MKSKRSDLESKMWSFNYPNLIANILLFLLLFTQLSNSRLACFSSNLSYCENNISTAQSECDNNGPSLVTGITTKSTGTVDFWMTCPWPYDTTFRVTFLCVFVLVLLNIHLVRLLLFQTAGLGILTLGYLVFGGVFLVSVYFDMSELLDSGCNFQLNYISELSCSMGFWFVANVALEFLSGAAMIFAAFSMIRWNRFLKMREKEPENSEYIIFDKDNTR